MKKRALAALVAVTVLIALALAVDRLTDEVDPALESWSEQPVLSEPTLSGVAPPHARAADPKVACAFAERWSEASITPASIAAFLEEERPLTEAKLLCLPSSWRTSLLASACKLSLEERAAAARLLLAALRDHETQQKQDMAKLSAERFECLFDLLKSAGATPTDWAALFVRRVARSKTYYLARDDEFLAAPLARLIHTRGSSHAWWSEFRAALPAGKKGLLIKFNALLAYRADLAPDAFVAHVRDFADTADLKQDHGKDLIVAGFALRGLLTGDLRIRTFDAARSLPWRRALLKSLPMHEGWPMDAGAPAALRERLVQWQEDRSQSGPVDSLEIVLLTTEWRLLGPDLALARLRAVAEAPAVADKIRFGYRLAGALQALEHLGALKKIDDATAVERTLANFFRALDRSELSVVVRTATGFRLDRKQRSSLVRVLGDRLEDLPKSTYKQLVY